MKNIMTSETGMNVLESCQSCGHLRHCGYACWDKDCDCEKCECADCLAPNERIGPVDI